MGQPIQVRSSTRRGPSLCPAQLPRRLGGGHTPGSIALYLPDDDAILTGDAVAEVNGQVAVGVFNTDRPAAVRAAGTIAATGARIAGFGHGEAIIGDAAARIAAAVDLFG